MTARNVLQDINLSAPGFLGINSVTSVEQPGWATKADNCIIDNNGRLAARKGWSQTTATPITGTPDITVLHEYLNSSYTSEIISVANSKIYSGTTTLTDITGTLTPAHDNWKFHSFNGNCIGFQDGETPIVYTGTGSFANVSFTYPTSGTNTFAGPSLAAFGRLWATDSSKTVLKYSDLLIYNSWTDDTGANGDGTGSAGILDMKTIWVYGSDQIVAIEQFNNFLIVFGNRNIAVFNTPTDPTAMALQDTVSGIGCAARDSVQNVGTDIFFLSETGVRSFRKTIQEKSMPLEDVTKHIRDDLLSYVDLELDKNAIRSVYYQHDGFYVLLLPTADTFFVIDTRRSMQDGAFRITTWSGMGTKDMLATVANTLYLGQAGYIGTYGGYDENGSSYTLTYKSTWMTLNNSRIKFPKDVITKLTGGNGYVLTFGLAYDYVDADLTVATTISSLSTIAEYGVATYGAGWLYSGGNADVEATIQAKGNGHSVRVGFTCAISGNSISFQNIRLYATLGRLN